MKILNELVGFLSKNKTKNIQIIGQVSPIDTHSRRLYDLIAKENQLDDAELALRLYGNHTQRSADSLRKLKSRLTNRMLNTVLLIDPEAKDQPVIDKAFLKANKMLIIGNLMHSRNLYHASKLCYNQVITLANTYDFTELKLLASARLRIIMGEIVQDRKEFLKYDQLFNQAYLEYNAEAYCQRNISNLISLLASSRKLVMPLTEEELSEIKTKFSELKGKYNTLTIERLYYLFFNLSNLLEGNYKEVIRLSDEAINHFSSRKYKLKNTILNMKNTKIMALLEIGRYNEGVELSSSIKDEYTYGDYNWYSNQYYLFLLLVYSGEYTRAAEELSAMLKAMNAKKLPEHLTENIKILTANIYFLHALGKIKSTELHTSITNFKINRFLNDIPTFSKDKRGLNISILILHVLIMLVNREYHKIIDRIEALNQYSSRYLRKDATFRSNVMVKILSAMVSADFHPVRTKRYTDDLFKKLQTVSRGVTEQGAEVEIIPYEDLWPMVLELLQKQ